MAKGGSRKTSLKYQLFVSHGWDDRWVAGQMARLAEEKAGVSAFVDIYDIKTGDRIADHVKNGLTACDELVALLTPRSAGRSWIWTEIGGVWTANKRVVGVLYGLTFDEIRNHYGGAACLEGVNCITIDEFEAYVEQLARRAAAQARGKQ